MSEPAELKNRVEDAIQRLTATHEQRRQSNQSLSEVLASLEAKYNSRADELAQCRARIRQLSESNDLLTALLERIVAIIETHADDGGDEAIRRTADMAKEIVESWGGDPAADAPVPDEPDGATGAPQARAAPEKFARAAAALPEMRFEDVAAEELAAELLAEASEQARAAGEGAEISDSEALPLDSAEIEDVAEVQEAAADHDVVELDQTSEVIDANESDAEAAAEAEAFAVAEADGNAPVFDEVEVVEEAASGSATEEIDFDSVAQEIEEVEIDVPAPQAAAAAAPARPPAPREKTRDDIRAMLDRLERAAARAQAFAEHQPKSKPAPSRSKERAS